MTNYRKPRMEIEHFDILKENQINEILEKTQPPIIKKSFHYKLVYVPILLMMIGILLFVPNLFKSSNNNLKLTKVSAQEYIIEGVDYKIGFKAFAIMENKDIIPYNEDFSYYKGLSKYIDVSRIIGDEINISIKSYKISERNFLQVEIDGEYEYYEIIKTNYIALIKIEDMKFTNFENDMQDIFNLIEDYPPTLVGLKENHTNKYNYDQSIHQLENKDLVSNYINYVSNFYTEKIEDDSYSGGGTIIIFNYLVHVDLNEDGEYKILSHAPSMNFISVRNVDTYTFKQDTYFNPLLDGLDHIIHFEHQLNRNLTILFNKENVYVRIKLNKISSPVNSTYNHVDIASIYIDTNKLSENNQEIEKIILKNRNTGEEFEVTDFITDENHLFSIPIIIHPTRENSPYHLDFILYDQQGNVILHNELDFMI